MNHPKFVLPESWKDQIGDFAFRQYYSDDYLLSETAEVLYFPEDLVIELEDGSKKVKFTWLEAMEIESFVRDIFPDMGLPTVSEHILLAIEATGDALDGEDVVRELELNRNGIGHPIGRGTANHEGKWAAYWSSTEAGKLDILDEYTAYALVVTADPTAILDRERRNVDCRLSLRFVYRLSVNS